MDHRFKHICDFAVDRNRVVADAQTARPELCDPVFFLDHAVESTVIGLELVFEHRNYLPSMFVFFPVAMGFKWLLDHYRERKSLLPQLLSCFMALLLFGFGFGTYVRNQAWDSEGSLWQDAVAKAPNSGRALHNLAWGYLERIGRPDLALQLYRKSLKLGTHNKVQQSMTLNNMANLYYQSKDYQKASDLWSQASGNSPKIEFFKYRLAMASTKSGDLANASYHLEQLLQKHPEDAEYNFLKGSILLKQKQYERALPCLSLVLKQQPNSAKALKKTGMILNLLGEYHRAALFLKGAHLRDPDDPSTLVWLIANSLLSENTPDADHYLNALISRVSVSQLESIIDEMSDPQSAVYSRRNIVIPAVEEKLREKFAVLTSQRSETIVSLNLNNK